MRQISLVDPRLTPVTVGAAEPWADRAVENPPQLRKWGFASDALAALVICLHVADALVIVAAGLSSYLIRYGTFSLPPPYWAQIVLCVMVFGLAMHIAGTYRFAALHNRCEHLGRVTGVWTAVVLTLIAIIYVGNLAEEFSRAWSLIWAFNGWLGLMGVRMAAWQVLRRLRARGRLVTHIAVVGQEAAAERCAQRLQANGNGEVQVIGIFADESDNAPGPRAGHSVADLAPLAAGMWIDEIVMAGFYKETGDLGSPLRTLSSLGVDIKLWLHFCGDSIDGYESSILVPIWERPLAGLPTLFKRAMDIIVSGILLAVLLPVMGFIAAAVKVESSGPVLFKQQRFGFSKKPFMLYKFRSMRWDAAKDHSVPQARRNDPRVTRVGRILRRTSLDELPQFINVLRGDMSLVGPRPHPTPLDEKFETLIKGYPARHRVKPGITGWAQVNGFRGETDTMEKMKRRLECDLFYIENWSPLLDMQILCRTPAVFLRQRNAY
jgi:putative colanic acid biosynthesis UDP-glucose lipid carrier transferase